MLLLLLANMDMAGGDGTVTPPEVEVPRRQGVVGGGFSVNDLYYQFEEWKEKKRLERELAEAEARLQKIEQKVERAKEKSVKEHAPAGILASLASLEKQERKAEEKIYQLQVRIEGLDTKLQELAAAKLRDEDDDDFEVMMMSH